MTTSHMGLLWVHHHDASVTFREGFEQDASPNATLEPENELYNSSQRYQL